MTQRHVLTVQGGVMALSKEERCRELARLAGIPLIEAEVTEVAEHFESLIQELARLMQLDLTHIQPVLVFPEEEP
jgi:Asp-tRNA(Asn)/Glu-tRNA(Gln) amidotransferase C subunit